MSLPTISQMALSAVLPSACALAYDYVCLRTEAHDVPLPCPISPCQIQMVQGSWSAQDGSWGWLCSRAPSASSRSSISGSAME